jgi:hypothetical protein
MCPPLQHQLSKKDSGDFPAFFWSYSTASDFGGWQGLGAIPATNQGVLYISILRCGMTRIRSLFAKTPAEELK